MYTHLKILCLALPLIALLHAEHSGIGQVDVRALALDSAADMPERYLKTKSGYELLEISSRQPRVAIQVLAEKQLNLYERSVGSDGEITFHLADQVPFKAEAKSVLLLVWSSANKILYRAVADNYAAASYDDWLLINMTSRPVEFQIGEETKMFEIKPNRSRACKLSLPKGTSAAVIGRSKWEDRTKTFYSTYLPIRGHERSIIIFTENDDRILVKKVSDVLNEGAAR